ncbi:MAG: ADP-forming succinate--CoA ligase subunit beta [Rhodospirillales bacterium]
MNLEEHAAKPLLAEFGIRIPQSRLASTPDEAAAIATEIGKVVVKAQAPTGKRGKAGGVKLAATPEEAREAAEAIIGMEIGGFKIEQVLVEEQVPIARELYAAILTDTSAKAPLLMFSTEGGMDIEEVAEATPEKVVRLNTDIRKGLDLATAKAALATMDLGIAADDVAATLVKLYRLYHDRDAEMVEINPLVLTTAGDVIALDCKFSLEDSGAARQPETAALATPEKKTGLEKRSEEHGLRYIELDGAVGVLANGAGLTMTTMDAISHYGGKPANFLEIGGEAYTKAKVALEIVLANPNVKSLMVNFCGAFARCDVMAEGVVAAWLELKPELPVFFSIHGTGEDEAIAMVRDRLGIEPYDLMDDAVKAAIEAAK